MKEPLPAARPLIERAYLERLDAERELDVRTDWRAAVFGGVAVTAAIILAAEIFGAIGALTVMAVPFAVAAVLDRQQEEPPWQHGQIK